MARVTTHTAAKDYPEQGIKKGETYYQWTPYRRGVQRSKTRPTPSQVSSAKTAVILDAIESARQAIGDAEEPSDFATVIEEVKSAADDVLSEYEEALEAWPNGNSQIEEKRDAVQSFCDECDGYSCDTSEYDDAVEALAEIEKKIAAQEEPPKRDEQADLLPPGDAEKEAAAVTLREALATELDEAQTAVNDALENLREEAYEVLDSAEF